MKKIFSIIIIALLSLFSINFSYLNASASNNITKDEIQEILTDFININPDRYYFSTGESKAASYIINQLKFYGYSDDQILLDEFSEDIEVESATFLKEAVIETYQSQNVILRINNNSSRRIVIASNYDNLYTDSNKNEGALDNASGVAISLALAQSLINQPLSYNIDICFFGAGYYNYTSSYKYIEKYGLSDVFAMFNLYRIGAESTYIYCDEIKTPLESYLLNKGDFKSVDNSIPLIDAQLLNGYPYTHFALIGNHSAFLEKGIPTVNIFSAYYKPLSLIDYEGTKDILGEDTLENLVNSYPDCFNKMTEAANLVLQSLRDNEFESAVLSHKSATDSILFKAWIAYIIFGAIAIISILCFYFIGKSLTKKYPIKVKKAKIAVFGTDYEKASEDEVFIEPYKRPSRHPFDEI